MILDGSERGKMESVRYNPTRSPVVQLHPSFGDTYLRTIMSTHGARNKMIKSLLLRRVIRSYPEFVYVHNLIKKSSSPCLSRISTDKGAYISTKVKIMHEVPSSSAHNI